MVIVPYCTLTLSDMGLSLKFHKGTTDKQQRKPVGLLELERGGGRIGTSYKGPYGEAPPPPRGAFFRIQVYIYIKEPGEICQVCERTYGLANAFYGCEKDNEIFRLSDLFIF